MRRKRRLWRTSAIFMNFTKSVLPLRPHGSRHLLQDSPRIVPCAFISFLERCFVLCVRTQGEETTQRSVCDKKCSLPSLDHGQWGTQKRALWMGFAWSPAKIIINNAECYAVWKSFFSYYFLFFGANLLVESEIKKAFSSTNWLLSST